MECLNILDIIKRLVDYVKHFDAPLAGRIELFRLTRGQTNFRCDFARVYGRNDRTIEGRKMGPNLKLQFLDGVQNDDKSFPQFCQLILHTWWNLRIRHPFQQPDANQPSQAFIQDFGRESIQSACDGAGAIPLARLSP